MISSLPLSSASAAPGTPVVGRREVTSPTRPKQLKDDLERAYVSMVFRESDGDYRKMMVRLGVKETQLYAMFRRLDLDFRRLRSR